MPRSSALLDRIAKGMGDWGALTAMATPVRSASALSGSGLKLLAKPGQSVKKANPNPLFAQFVPDAEVLVSADAKLNAVAAPEQYVYDLTTKAGQTYVLVSK